MALASRSVCRSTRCQSFEQRHENFKSVLATFYVYYKASFCRRTQANILFTVSRTLLLGLLDFDGYLSIRAKNGMLRSKQPRKQSCRIVFQRVASCSFVRTMNCRTRCCSTIRRCRWLLSCSQCSVHTVCVCVCVCVLLHKKR